MKTRLFAFTMAIFSIFSAAESRGQAPGGSPPLTPLVLAVDGLAFREVGPGLELKLVKKQPDGYLGTAIGRLVEGKSAEVRPYTWSRDPGETRAVIDHLKTTIVDLSEAAKKENRPFVIVGHSWGGVMAYGALRELESERKEQGLPAIETERFVTMGSQLGKPSLIEGVAAVEPRFDLKDVPDLQKVVKGEIAKPAGVKEWINMWAEYDRVSGSIAIGGVKDIQIDRDAVARESQIQALPLPPIGASTIRDPDLKRLKDLDTWHKAYYEGVHGLRLESLGETINWDIPKDYLAAMLPEMPAGRPTIAMEIRAPTETGKLREFLKKAAKPTPQLGINVSVQTALQDFKSLAKVFEPIAKPFVPLVKPISDAAQLAQRTAQQQLTPVTSSFTQTYSGTMSQTIGVSGSRTTPFSGSFTGTRTGAAPGDFTGTFTGTNVYNPPVFANPNYRNISFTATMTGQVNGFQGQDLKGTANATITDGLVPTGNTFTYSGNVTIKTDKSLSAPSLTGDNFQHRGIPGITPRIVGTSAISHTQTPR